MSTEGTLWTAARAFGALVAQPSGREAVQTLGLSGDDAPAFVCAIYDTTIEEVAPYAPTTVLVIDVVRGRLATLGIPGTPTSHEDYDVHPTTKLGFLVDCMGQSRQADMALGILGEVRGTVTELVA